MRIGIIWECPWVPSSYGKLSLWLTYGLMREGFDVRVYCPSVVEMPAYHRCLEYRVLCLHRELGVCVDPGRFIEVCNPSWACGDGGDDVDVYVIGGSPYGGVESRWVERCSRSRKPVAGYFVTETPVLQPLLASWLFHVDAVGFPARAVAESFLSFEPVREVHKDWVLAPHGLPDYYYDLHPDEILAYSMSLLGGDAERLKPILESRREGSVYGTVGKDHPRKDYAALLSAFTLLKNKHRDRRLKLFIGLVKAVGAPMWNIDAMMGTLGLENEDVVSFESKLEESGVSELGLLHTYSLMNVFTFATLGEGFGLPPVEAGALGIPVVVTRTPVTEEVWEGYPLLVRSRPILVSEGFILYGTDYKDLADKMEILLDGGERERYGKQARGIAQKYTLDRMTEGVIKLCQLAEEKRGTKKPHPLQKYEVKPTQGYKERVLRVLFQGI